MGFESEMVQGIVEKFWCGELINIQPLILSSLLELQSQQQSSRLRKSLRLS